MNPTQKQFSLNRAASRKQIPISSFYKKLYALYKQLHDAFGTKQWNGNLHNVMKELIAIRDSVRK